MDSSRPFHSSPREKASIDETALKSRIEQHLSDKCTELVPFEQCGHHMTYTAHMGKRQQIFFIRVQWSILKHAGCGLAFPSAMRSEVSTIRFLKARTKIPVPEILFHDLDVDGKVGGEWMIMEYVDGENLSTIWRTLDVKQREQVCLAMADVWVRIISITFDSIGSIYEQDGGEFVIGPMARLASNRSTSIASPRLEKCGPFSNVKGWLLATARRDLDYVEAPEDVDTSSRGQHFIDGVVTKIRHFSFPCPDLPLVLEHIDFAPRNILVSRTDPTKIVAVIDWEGSRSVPMWAANPNFTFPPESVTEEERKRLLTLLTNRVISQVPEWERAIGQELQPLRILHDRATYSKVDPSVLPPAPYLAMSASY
ncbi:kinase-like domain-containing protein [Armillaria fumosa]|nr:kinase-like domain-containing protein [Armillaria fumosa]